MLILALGWMNRKAIGQNYLTHWCVEQGLECQASFAELGFGGAEIESLRIARNSAVPVAAKRIFIELAWPAFLRPEIVSISIDRPVLRAIIENGEPSAYGLEDVIEGMLAGDVEPDVGAPSRAFPKIDIKGGVLILATDAGEIISDFAVQGQLPGEGSASCSVRPNTLKQGLAEIAWSRGNIDLVFKDGAIVGDIDFAIEKATLEGVLLEGATLLGRFSDKAADGRIAFEFGGNLNALKLQGLQAEAVTLQSRGGLDYVEEVNAQALLSALAAVEFSAAGANIVAGARGMQTADISLDLARFDGGLRGPVAGQFGGVKMPEGGAESLVATGEIALGLDAANAAYRYKGSTVFKNAFLSQTIQRALLSDLVIPAPFEAHGQNLRSAAAKAMAGFDIGIDFDARLSARQDEQAGNTWQVEAGRPTLLTARSGLKFSIDPFLNQPWLRASNERIMLAGDISLGGAAGVPEINGALDELLLAGKTIEVKAHSMKLSPWRASGRTLSAMLASLELELGARTRMIVNGELGLSGALPGLTLEPTRLIGHVSAVRAAEGWRVQTRNNSCVGFTSGGMTAGALKLAGTDLSLCPVEGRFVRQEKGQSVGRIQIGDIDVPFATTDAKGHFEVQNAGLEWRAGDGFNLLVRGARFALPLQFSEETLTINGLAPEVSFGLDGGPVKIAAGLGRTEFGGTMVPAKVVARAFSFEGATSQSGVDGVMRAGQVRISDLKADPVYKPLMAEFEAILKDGSITMTGPIRSEAKGVTLANAELNLHLAEFTGDAHVTMEPLTFSKGGLQPVHLSEMLRGVLINARGGMAGRADFEIRDGALSGTGYVDFIDLILDTFSAGTLTGVSGRVNFSDILALTTLPHQEINIGFMDPGVPLSDGVVTFQIVEATTTKLERALWPFAGGEIVVLPAVFQAGAGASKLDTIIVEARAWELDRLVEVLQVPDLRATGTVSGRFPIDLEGANIMIRNATLIADDKGGTLAYTGGVTDTVKGQNQYADYAFSALRDLDYTVMEIGAEGNLIGSIVVTANLLGRNKDVLGGAEFDFKLSVDSELSKLLRSASEDARDNYISEAIALKEKREKQGAR